MWEEWLEYLPAHFAMQFAHAIHAAAPLQSKIGHVEGLCIVGWVLPSDLQQIVNRDAKFILRIVAKILPDKLRIKAIKASRDCGVCRKDIASPRNGQSQIKWLLMILHITARPFEHRKGRMAFIEMADFRLQTERSQQAPPTDPENEIGRAHV